MRGRRTLEHSHILCVQALSRERGQRESKHHAGHNVWSDQRHARVCVPLCTRKWCAANRAASARLGRFTSSHVNRHSRCVMTWQHAPNASALLPMELPAQEEAVSRSVRETRRGLRLCGPAFVSPDARTPAQDVLDAVARARAEYAQQAALWAADEAQARSTRKAAWLLAAR